MGLASKLRFLLEGNDLNFQALGETFLPNGQFVLNSLEWRDKEPMSCAITGLKSEPTQGNQNPTRIHLEVTYRPPGHISYHGHVQYTGWNMMLPKKDGTGALVDEEGTPIDEDAPPFLEPHKVYDDLDFNDLNFGTFIDEVETERLIHRTYEEMFNEIMRDGEVSAGGTSAFMAPHRSRPTKKIMLSSSPTQTIHSSGEQIFNINNSTPNLESVLMRTVAHLMCEFMEGKASLPGVQGTSSTFVQLSRTLVDCAPNEDGLDSFFDAFRFHAPEGFLEDLAKRLMALYVVDIEVVDGEKCGLLLRQVKE